MNKRLRFFTKARFLIPLILVILFLLFAGIFAITQETSGEEMDEDDLVPEELVFDFLDDDEETEEFLPEWIPPGPPRWFRSNVSGMALEEIPSRFAALRNNYALVIDYLPPDEIDPRLLRYYDSDYTVEIHVLFMKEEEIRRQWQFLDEEGVVRLNAVFRIPPEKTSGKTGFAGEYEKELDEEFDGLGAELSEADGLAVENPAEDFSDMGIPDPVSAPASKKEAAESAGFIEIFNGKTQITEDHWLYEDGGEFQVFYSYNENILIKAEAYKESPGFGPDKMYTDHYRYNRSYSLRHVDRLYHQEMELKPARQAFPYLVLEAARGRSFRAEKLYVSPEFFGDELAGEGFRMVYDTDGKGRILAQTMLDSNNETVWVIKNTWSGDRIIATKKTEGKDEKLTEYEYDSAGNRLVQRDIHNGEPEGVVYTDGAKETEELYMNGAIILKAYWENGRKISEERVRRR